MKPEMIICPFCGGVYRESVSLGTARVKCKYCGGAILVPQHFSGASWPCPNHPDVSAVGSCNDCSERYCDTCLCYYSLEGGTLHLCPACFKARKSKEASAFLWIGVFFLFFGFLLSAAARNVEESLVIGALFFGFIAIPIFAWGIYRMTHLPKGLSVRENRESIERERETKESLGSHSTYELYNVVLGDYMQTLGSCAFNALEHETDAHVNAGLSRSEAVRKIAERKGYSVEGNA